MASMARWAQIPPGDLQAIRGFIREFKGTWAADEAQQHIERLEQFAWRGVLGHDDLAIQLNALAAFRSDYPDGVHILEAVTLENQRREALDRIGTNLISLGYMAVAEADDLATLRMGVEAFERSTGLRPSGRITENLSVLLAAAVLSRRSSRTR
jgi:hypothetical protein